MLKILKRSPMKKLLLNLFILNIATPLISLADNQPSSKHVVYTKNAPAPIVVYSQAIKVNKTVYISGQISIDPKTGELVKGDFNTQFKQAILNLNEVAKAAGGSLDNIVKVSVYLTDLNNFPTVNNIMKTYFHEPYPARAVIEIKKLPKNATVEIEA